MTILIKNGQVINPATKMNQKADVLIENGKVKKITQDILEEAEQVIDAEGCLVMPGFIDLHVHFRDPGLEYKEDIFSGMKAAAAGGFTTVLAMPNTKPVADCSSVIEYVHKKAKSTQGINVLQVGAVTKGQQGKELADIEEMVQAGSPAISEDGKSVMDTGLYREAMIKAAELDIPVLAHCEDINLVQGGVMNLDSQSKNYKQPGISNAVEDIIAARDILLAKETNATLHLCHCSTKDSVEMVRQAKEEGIKVTAEVCPHHFILSSGDIAVYEPKEGETYQDYDLDTNYKMNPPLRTKEDVNALIAGLSSDIMDVISTDHAPHSEEEKHTTMKKAPFGIVGLETAAALTYSALVQKGHLTKMQMAEKMSYNPAKVLKIDKGDIQPGKVADIVIFNPSETYVIDKNTFLSKGRNTPFHGMQVTGKVKYTICNGTVVYADGR